MNPGRWLVIAAMLVGCFVIGVYASGIEPKPMSAGDASDFARQALEESGVRNATVTGKVEASSFQPERGKPLKVWKVPAKVGDDVITLFIEQLGDQVLNLDDLIGPDRHVLTQEQFAALGRFRDDPVGDRARSRQLLPALVAGALLGGTGATLAIVVGSGRVNVGLAKPQEADAIPLAKIE